MKRFNPEALLPGPSTTRNERAFWRSRGSLIEPSPMDTEARLKAINQWASIEDLLDEEDKHVC
jgi:hypothetical protein